MNNTCDTQKAIHDFALNYPLLNLPNGKILANDHSCFYVESGSVRFFLNTTCGHEYTAHIYKIGSLFPILKLFTNQLEHFKLQAFSDTKLRVIPADAVRNFISHDPLISMHFLSKLSLGTSKLILRLGQSYFCSARNRIISTIFLLLDSYGIDKSFSDKNKMTLNKKISHEQLASLAGLTRETCSRELEKLKSDGIIAINYRQIVILKFDELIENAKTHNLTADMLSSFPDELNKI